MAEWQRREPTGLTVTWALPGIPYTIPLTLEAAIQQQGEAGLRQELLSRALTAEIDVVIAQKWARRWKARAKSLRSTLAVQVARSSRGILGQSVKRDVTEMANPLGTADNPTELRSRIWREYADRPEIALLIRVFQDTERQLTVAQAKLAMLLGTELLRKSTKGQAVVWDEGGTLGCAICEWDWKRDSDTPKDPVTGAYLPPASWRHRQGCALAAVMESFSLDAE